MASIHIYVGREIQKDIRKTRGECSHCKREYNKTKVGSYCPIDGREIVGDFYLEEGVRRVLNGLEIVAIKDLSDKKIKFYLAKAAIDYKRTKGAIYVGGGGEYGNTIADIPSNSELSKLESIAKKARIEFINGSSWQIILDNVGRYHFCD